MTARIKLTYELYQFILFIQSYHTAWACRNSVNKVHPYFVTCEMKNPMTVWSAVSNRYIMDTFGLTKAEITMDAILEIPLPDEWDEGKLVHLEIER